MNNHKKWLRRLRLQEIEIHMGMFDFKILCVIGKQESLSEYVTFKQEKKFDASAYNSFGLCIARKDFCPIIWIPRLPKTPREYGTLAHECLHAVGHLTRWAGVDFTSESEETYCHALTYLIKTILSK